MGQDWGLDRVHCGGGQASSWPDVRHEEENKLRAGEREQWLRIVGWHMQVLGHRKRQVMHMQGQHAWLQLIGLEGSTRAISYLANAAPWNCLK